MNLIALRKLMSSDVRSWWDAVCKGVEFSGDWPAWCQC